MIGERVRPQHDGAPLACPARSLPRRSTKLRGEGLGGKPRHLARARDVTYALGDPAQPGRVGDEIGDPGRNPGQTGPLVDEPHRIRGTRPQSPLVVVRKELRLVGSHVDPNGALALAGLARETKIEGSAHVVVSPAIAVPAPKHLVKEMGAPARGVLLLAQNHEARAHGPAVQAAALAHADASFGGAQEAAVIVREAEVCLGSRPEGDPKTKIVRAGRGVHHLAGVHPVPRVPDPLEGREGAHELVAEELAQVLGAGLPVPVLARKGAAETYYEVSGVLHECPVPLHALVGAEVEWDARVHAALSKVTVERRLEAVLLEHPAQRAQVPAQLLHRNR